LVIHEQQAHPEDEEKHTLKSRHGAAIKRGRGWAFKPETRYMVASGESQRFPRKHGRAGLMVVFALPKLPPHVTPGAPSYALRRARTE
jgi:hypothetical protein